MWLSSWRCPGPKRPACPFCQTDPGRPWLWPEQAAVGPDLPGDLCTLVGAVGPPAQTPDQQRGLEGSGGRPQETRRGSLEAGSGRRWPPPALATWRNVLQAHPQACPALGRQAMDRLCRTVPPSPGVRPGPVTLGSDRRAGRRPRSIRPRAKGQGDTLPCLPGVSPIGSGDGGRRASGRLAPRVGGMGWTTQPPQRRGPPVIMSTEHPGGRRRHLPGPGRQGSGVHRRRRAAGPAVTRAARGLRLPLSRGGSPGWGRRG